MDVFWLSLNNVSSALCIVQYSSTYKFVSNSKRQVVNEEENILMGAIHQNMFKKKKGIKRDQSEWHELEAL